MNHHPSLLRWQFPLPRPYTGILLGNGVQGLMIWGDDCLSITVGRTGFWDRRGGVSFASQTSFSQLREILESGDQDALKAAFSNPKNLVPYRTPTQLPGGRLDLFFQDGAKPESACLDTRTGRLEVTLSDGETLVIHQDMLAEISWISCRGASITRAVLVPAWHYLAETLAPGGVLPPEMWETGQEGGFFQSLPSDPGLAIAWCQHSDGQIAVTTALGPDAAQEARRLASKTDLTLSASRTQTWWDAYWQKVPSLQIPDPALQRAWEYGLWKQAGLTTPQGIPATLQGAWMAETQLPPWSNDFHFNINLQMIYWPALPTNCTDHLLPIWEMLADWLPTLRDNAAKFFNSPTAMMLPHAVDDQCHVIGNFWQGTVDQACTAWMAQIAWMHYRHTLDENFLRETAWPLLVGAFDGFWAMSEEIERDGEKVLSLPVSVSAEFAGWGRDASFQLAAFHLMAQLIPQAAFILGETLDPRWQQVSDSLPPYTTENNAKVWGQKEPLPRIVLWKGLDLPESHRHHSHLAAIYPFCTISHTDEKHREMIKRSLEHWASMGPGQWAGWSMPWASMIWSRCDLASAAVTILRIWEEVFTNEGHGTLHNADSSGYTSWIHGPFLDGPQPPRDYDQMQMDAGMGAIQAIAEILIQQRGDTLYVLPSIPKQWREFSFDGILAEGAFLVGATVTRGRVTEIRITSQKTSRLRLAHNLGDTFLLNSKTAKGAILDIRTSPAQQILLQPSF